MPDDSLLNEYVELLTEWIGLVREIVAKVAQAEAGLCKASKREKARGRWTILLGVMLSKVAEGIGAIAPTKNVRALEILVRSIFEYEQKAEFFLTHKKEAFEQYASIDARVVGSLSKLAHSSPSIQDQLLEVYRKWQRTSGNRDEYSGNRELSKMHLEVVPKERIESDKDGNSFTSDYETAYGLPSWYVHGDPILMGEVFRHVKDDSKWEYRENVTYLSPTSPVGLASAYLLKFCYVVSKAYGLKEERKQAGMINRRFQELLKAEATKRGLPYPIRRTGKSAMH